MLHEYQKNDYVLGSFSLQHHHTTAPEPIIPLLQYSNIPIVSKVT